jgi:hypothetical protein
MFKRQKMFRKHTHGGAKQLAIVTVSDSIANACISFILWHPMSNGLMLNSANTFSMEDN